MDQKVLELKNMTEKSGERSLSGIFDNAVDYLEQGQIARSVTFLINISNLSLASQHFNFCLWLFQYLPPSFL